MEKYKINWFKTWLTFKYHKLNYYYFYMNVKNIIIHKTFAVYDKMTCHLFTIIILFSSIFVINSHSYELLETFEQL